MFDIFVIGTMNKIFTQFSRIFRELIGKNFAIMHRKDCWTGIFHSAVIAQWTRKSVVEGSGTRNIEFRRRLAINHAGH